MMIDAEEYLNDPCSPLPHILHSLQFPNFFYLTALLKEWGRKATCGENFDFQVKHIKEIIKLPEHFDLQCDRDETNSKL